MPLIFIPNLTWDMKKYYSIDEKKSIRVENRSRALIEPTVIISFREIDTQITMSNIKT